MMWKPLPAVAVVGLFFCGCADTPERTAPQQFLPLLDRALAASPEGVTGGAMPAPSALVPPVDWGGAEDAERARRVSGSSGSGIGGGVSSGDGSVFCALSDVATFSWRSAIEASASGVPQVAIAHADAQATVLADAGFVPFTAGMSTVHAYGEELEYRVRDADGGSSITRTSTRPARLVHRRIYHAPHTSAFVLSRLDYDGATGVATAEITVVEATPDSAARSPSDFATPVREQLAPAQ